MTTIKNTLEQNAEETKSIHALLDQANNSPDSCAISAVANGILQGYQVGITKGYKEAGDTIQQTAAKRIHLVTAPYFAAVTQVQECLKSKRMPENLLPFIPENFERDENPSTQKETH